MGLKGAIEPVQLHSLLVPVLVSLNHIFEVLLIFATPYKKVIRCVTFATSFFFNGKLKSGECILSTEDVCEGKQ